MIEAMRFDKFANSIGSTLIIDIRWQRRDHRNCHHPINRSRNNHRADGWWHNYRDGSNDDESAARNHNIDNWRTSYKTSFNQIHNENGSNNEDQR